jgi:hypothetical protein
MQPIAFLNFEGTVKPLCVPREFLVVRVMITYYTFFFFVAGTHDLSLAMTTLHSLRALNQEKASAWSNELGAGNSGDQHRVHTKAGSSPSSAVISEVLIPRFDKSLRQGRGDRVDRSQWQVVSGIVLLFLLTRFFLPCLKTLVHHLSCVYTLLDIVFFLNCS